MFVVANTRMIPMMDKLMAKFESACSSISKRTCLLSENVFLAKG